MCTSVYTWVHVQIPVKGLGTYQILFIHRALKVKFWNFQGLFFQTQALKGTPVMAICSRCGEAVSSVGLQAFGFLNQSPSRSVLRAHSQSQSEWQTPLSVYLLLLNSTWGPFMKYLIHESGWWWMDDFILTLCSTIFFLRVWFRANCNCCFML